MQRRGQPAFSRRRLLRLGALGLAASSLELIDALAVRPWRVARAEAATLPSIQFDIADHVAPAQAIDGTLFEVEPVFTLFITARLKRTPALPDQQVFEDALSAIEASYPFNQSGILSCIGYGIPYFNRLPGGMTGGLMAPRMPRLLLDRRRYALEEAVPSPTDVSPANPDVIKQTFHLPVVIEDNDLLLTLRSDVQGNLTDVLAWLLGSNVLAGTTVASPALGELLEVTSARLMFVQRGLPRRLAAAHELPYAGRIHPESPLWMGFASQQADSSGPVAIVTVQGNRSAQFTTAAPGDYFADAAIQHLSHVVLDLEQWYGDAEPYVERVQQMFRSTPIPATGNPDQFTDGGGPAFLPNAFRGRDDARQSATGFETYDGGRRLGHTSSLQRASRAGDGTPIHLRVDGPGFDALDVPDGSNQPKLHFSMFVPTAEVFERMRRYQAGTDLAGAFGVSARATGIERFITTTRRQNFLVPPRRHRALPLIELA